MERTVNAAVYVRISQDRGGEGLGVARQETLCRDLADRKGWTVAEVYVDNDIGAYTGKPRPGYQRMLDDLAAGRRDAVVVVDHDRLTRHLRELEDFIDLADTHAVALANVSGEMDLSTSDGRFRARIMGAVARHESEQKSDRLQRERAQRATQGRPHPGPRAFGFRPGNMTHDLREAELIREAAAAVLAGKSIRSVANAWNTAGITTARGNRWTIGAVGDVLTSPRTAGLRQHQGEIVGDGQWPAILDRDTWERLRTIAKSRRRSTGRPATRLLSAIATCSLCGGPMHSSTDHGKPVYACRWVEGKKDDNCGRLSIVAAPLDAFVRDMIVAAIDEGDLAERVAVQRGDSDRRDLTAELRADEAALEQAGADYYVDRVISRAMFFRTRRDLEDRIEATRKLVAASAAADTLDELPDTGNELRVWWDAADRTSEDRRQLVERLLVRVPILPRLPRMPRQFDPGRVDVDNMIWRV